MTTFPENASSNQAYPERDLVARTKEYLSDPRHRIKLHDLAMDEVRKLRSTVNNPDFNNFPRPDTAVVSKMLSGYEAAVRDLQSVVTVVSYWGKLEHRLTIGKVLSYFVDSEADRTGISTQLSFRYYPAMLLMYSGGISAIASENYEMLTAIFATRVTSGLENNQNHEFIVEMGQAALELERSKLFYALPGHERQYVPRSEYLFKVLMPNLEDLLFLGKSYEELFDRFEILFALDYADITSRPSRGYWGPVGRFAWKHRSRDHSIYTKLVKEAEVQQDNWPALKGGLFGGSYERFKEVASNYVQLINNLGWH